MFTKRIAFCLLGALATVMVATIVYRGTTRLVQRHPIEQLAHVARDPDGAIVAVEIKGNRVVGHETLAQLKKMPRLKLLDLGIQVDMTDADFIHLRELEDLDDLSLRGAITDGGLAHLASLTKLQTLRLSRTNVTDAGLVHLQGLKNLKYLWLDGCNLTDDGVASLAGLTNLRRLSLADTRISGTGLMHLSGLNHLEDLNLMRNQLASVAELAELKRQLPQCTITFTEHPFLDALMRADGDLLAALKSTGCNIKFNDQGHVVSLDLSPTTVNPYELEYLKTLKSLKELHLNLASGDMTFDLRGFENIERLALSHANSCDGLDTLDNLRTFRVRGSIDASHMLQLTKLPRLEQLALGHAPVGRIPDDTLVYLDDFARLKSLTIERNYYGSYFTDADLAAISKATGLEQLVLRSPRGRITYKGCEHLEKLTSLRKLVLDIPRLSFAGHHLTSLQNLRSIHISGHFTDGGLQHVASLHNLRSIHISGHLTDVGLLRSDFKQLKDLEELTFITQGSQPHMRRQYRRQFESLFIGSPAWRISMDGISGAGLSHLVDLRNVKRLHVEGNVSRLSELSVNELSGLQSFSMPEATFPDTVLFVFLKNLGDLETLVLTGVNVTDAALEHLAGSRKLKSLTLAKSAITDKGAHQILPLTLLEKLNLSNTQITDSAVAGLSSLHNLKELDLDNCPNVTISAIQQLKSQLPDVNVTFNPLMAYGLHDLEQFGTGWELDATDHLTDFYVGHPSNSFTDQHLARLGSIKTLVNVNLGDTNITGVGLSALKGCSRLRLVNLQGSRAVTDVALANLKEMTQLQYLFVGSCRDISDQGLAHLKAMTQLRRLSLIHCPNVSDIGLEHLRGLTHLQNLKVAGTGVTYSGVYRLRRALPWCKIEWP